MPLGLVNCAERLENDPLVTQQFSSPFISLSLEIIQQYPLSPLPPSVRKTKSFQLRTQFLSKFAVQTYLYRNFRGECASPARNTAHKAARGAQPPFPLLGRDVEEGEE